MSNKKFFLVTFVILFFGTILLQYTIDFSCWLFLKIFQLADIVAKTI